MFAENLGLFADNLSQFADKLGQFADNLGQFADKLGQVRLLRPARWQLGPACRHPMLGPVRQQPKEIHRQPRADTSRFVLS